MLRAALLALALSACASPQAPTLDGTSWTMTGENPAPTIAFAEGGASGSTGCNRWSADTTPQGAGVRIGMIAVTEMACPGPAMDTEARFLSTLQATSIVEVRGDALVFVGANAEELARLAPAP
jgi:heat shock protein HslJ